MNMEPVTERTEIRIQVELTPQTPFVLEDARVVIASDLIALKEKGKLFGVIADLEKESAPEAEKDLQTVLHWLGIHFAENQFTPGGVYRQSRQIQIYRSLLYKMLREEKACLRPCPDKKKSEIFQNSGTKSKTSSFIGGSALPIAEVDFAGDAAFGFEVYLAPDLLNSNIFAQTEMDSVPEPIRLWNSDGKPSANFANCVDRHLLGISHVACWTEQTEDRKKENQISVALGWKGIQYLVFSKNNANETSQSPFRKVLPVSLIEFERAGYLSRAMSRFLGQGSEQISINTGAVFIPVASPARYTIEYLNELNQQELQQLDLEILINLIKPYLNQSHFFLEDGPRLRKILGLLQKHCHSLSVLAEEMGAFFQQQSLDYSPSARSVLRLETSQKVLWSFLRRLREVESMSKDVFLSIMHNVQKETGILGKDLWNPVRIALTGGTNSYELALVAEILGKENCVTRITGIVGNYW